MTASQTAAPAPASPPPNVSAVPVPNLPAPSSSSSSSVATGGTPAAPARPGAHDGGGYRDTIESILIAFILAFIFRAFVVEAFVIPTGSMAPTLLGAHARFICDDCGYRFDVNYSAGGDDQNIPPSVRHNEFARIDCPNCAHTVHDPRDSNSQEPVEIHYGDRILVLKYAYLFGNEPSRWDVVVFKSPDSPVEGTSWYATNFIKRLVGKPGETVMILDGDVYVSTTGASDPAAFKVQPKPRNVQEALWRVVYDNEFLPKAPPDGAADRGQRWTADEGSGWDVGTADAPRRVFTFDAAAGAAGAVTFDNGANEGRAFTDWLAYAQVEQARNLSRLNNVSDVKLSLLYHRRGGDGPLRLQLTKLEDTFTAEVAPAGVKLFRKRGAPAGPDDLGEEVASAAAPAGLGGGPALLEFTNVDYRVTLRVAGRDVLAASYDPDVAALRAAHDAERKLPKPTVRIAAAGQACDLSDVSLWRDVYYTNGPRRRPYDSQDGITWGIPEQPIALGADEYFVLGDNTVISKDARFWSTPINLPEEGLEAQAGVVPGRFLLGKAFFVYWPAGFRTAITMRRLSAIPNFGDMRLIE